MKRDDFDEEIVMTDRVKEAVELETLLTTTIALAPENGGEGEEAKARALIEWMEKKGLAGGSAPCKIERYDAPDSRVPRGKRPNVVVTLQGRDDAAGAVWVISHLDVVPAGDMDAWKTDPWQVVEKDGVLYGRGVEDDQSGIVSSIIALMDVAAGKKLPRRTIKLLFVADEEIGSEYGMKYLLREHNLFRKDDIIIVPDGGDPRGETIEVAEKSVMWVKFTVTGIQSHASRPDLGKNACIAACDLSLRIHALENTFNARDALFTPDNSSFSPTMRTANVACLNIIPGSDVFHVDIRLLPSYSPDSAVAEIEKTCRKVEAEYGVSIKSEVLKCTSSPATSSDANVVKALSKALASSRNIHATPIGIGGGTVAAMLREKGYDAAVWSTIEDTAHMPNEKAVIANILADASTLAALFTDEE